MPLLKYLVSKLSTVCMDGLDWIELKIWDWIGLEFGFGWGWDGMGWDGIFDGWMDRQEKNQRDPVCHGRF